MKTLLALLAAVTFASVPSSAGGADERGVEQREGRISGTAHDNVLDIIGVSSDDGASKPSASGPAEFEYSRVAQIYCGTLDAVAVTAPCVDGAPSGTVVRVCDDGSQALDPLFRRPIDPSTGRGAGPWEPTSDTGGCPEDPDAPLVLTAEDFQRLPLTPSTPAIQPADGQTLLNVPTILHTDPAPQELTTTVLGTTVRVRATPTTWTWDPGDGTRPLTTTDPGAPYPRHTISHTYTRPGTYTLTLTTTWTGHFQVPGGTWLPVTGTATTTSPALTITAHEARSTLVADPLP